MRPARWFSAVLVTVALAPGARAALDDAQRAWLATRGAVIGAPERDYGPFVFATEAGVEGLSIDMLSLVQRHTGLVVRWRAAAPLQELLAAARARGRPAHVAAADAGALGLPALHAAVRARARDRDRARR